MRQRGEWLPAVFPLPDTIYDQVISRRLERRAEHSARREKLSKLFAGRMFNDGFFDKWQVYEWLSKDPAVRRHLPSTIRYGKVHDASVFVHNHTTTFLKPVHGSLGLGIIRLTRQADGSVAFDVKRLNSPPFHGRASSPAEAVRVLRKRLASKPYLIQEGVSLVTYHDRPFDIRILLQKDGTGKWRRTKMFARVTQAGDVTSNLSSGGEAVPVSEVLAELCPTESERRRCRVAIRRVCTLVAETLEQQSQKTFGELGIDVGLDEQSQVWIIEVNSKPWKTPSTERGRQDLVELAFKRPIQYAIRLAGQK